LLIQGCQLHRHRGKPDRVDRGCPETQPEQRTVATNVVRGETVTVGSKTLLPDLADLGLTLDNVEGMMLGPRLPAGDCGCWYRTTASTRMGNSPRPSRLPSIVDPPAG